MGWHGVNQLIKLLLKQNIRLFMHYLSQKPSFYLPIYKIYTTVVPTTVMFCLFFSWTLFCNMKLAKKLNKTNRKYILVKIGNVRLKETQTLLPFFCFFKNIFVIYLFIYLFLVFLISVTMKLLGERKLMEARSIYRLKWKRQLQNNLQRHHIYHQYLSVNCSRLNHR